MKSPEVVLVNTRKYLDRIRSLFDVRIRVWITGSYAKGKSHPGDIDMAIETVPPELGPIIANAMRSAVAGSDPYVVTRSDTVSLSKGVDPLDGNRESAYSFYTNN